MKNYNLSSVVSISNLNRFHMRKKLYMPLTAAGSMLAASVSFTS